MLYIYKTAKLICISRYVRCVSYALTINKSKSDLDKIELKAIAYICFLSPSTNTTARQIDCDAVPYEKGVQKEQEYNYCTYLNIGTECHKLLLKVIYHIIILYSCGI